MTFPQVPFPAPTTSRGGKGSSAFSPAVVAIISVLGSAFLVVSYYRIFAKVCTRWQNRRAAELDVESQLNGNDTDANNSPLPARGLDEALIKKIPIFQYKRGDGFTIETECPVCLMEFVDKQELRMLPKCAHAFHIQCIDTWLASHSNCPLCRANIFTEQVMSQFRYPPALSPPQIHHSRMHHFFGTPPHGSFSPASSPADYSMGDFARFSNGQGRSPAPTLRGLLDFEDHQQNHEPPPMMWLPNGSESGRAEEPGEESLRLYDPRDYGGDSSSRHHHALVIPTSGSFGGSVPSAPASTDPPQAPRPPQQGDVVNRTASFKEGHQRSRSRDSDHKWHMHPARRSSSRRNPFASMRSFSMGTSRRLANALEFLDLEGLRSGGSSSSHQIMKGGDKLFSSYEYGITETPDYNHHHDSPANILPVASADLPSLAGGAADRDTNELVGRGSSSERKENLRSLSSLRYANIISSGDTVDSSGPVVKGSPSSRIKGRSLSFTSPFRLRSLSGGRNVFSLRYSGRSSRIFSWSTSPPPSTAPAPPNT